jgi:hypothetical protein
MMPDLQALSQLANGNRFASGKALDCEEGLVLLGSEAGFFGGVFAEMQEPAQGVAERGEGFVFGPGHLRGGG